MAGFPVTRHNGLFCGSFVVDFFGNGELSSNFFTQLTPTDMCEFSFIIMNSFIAKNNTSIFRLQPVEKLHLRWL